MVFFGVGILGYGIWKRGIFEGWVGYSGKIVVDVYVYRFVLFNCSRDCFIDEFMCVV